jgi:protocatechuate 3,4-dioxygenase beta subunit
MPIAGAVVEIWHADAGGNYSGYPEELAHDAWRTLLFLVRNGERRGGSEIHVPRQSATTFLRGLQRSDGEGRVEFRTIFPGWYTGRVPHLHLRATTLEGQQVTTQFYFEPELHDRLYTNTRPYDRYGKCPATFATDGVLARGPVRVEAVLLKVAWSAEGPLNAVVRMSIEPA